MKSVVGLVSLALVVGGCGLQAGRSARTAPAGSVGAAASVQALHKLVLESSSNWPATGVDEVRLDGRLDGFRTRIRVAKDLATSQVSFDVSGAFMSKWELERTLDAAEVGPGVWRADLRKAIDFLRWGRADAKSDGLQLLPASRIGASTPATAAAEAPALTGITYKGQGGEAFSGETSQTMSLAAVVSNPTGAPVSYRWKTDGEYLGWPDRQLFHFIGFRPATFAVTCTLVDGAGKALGSQQVTITLKRAPLPPDRK